MTASEYGISSYEENVLELGNSKSCTILSIYQKQLNCVFFNVSQ